MQDEDRSKNTLSFKPDEKVTSKKNMLLEVCGNTVQPYVMERSQENFSHIKPLLLNIFDHKQV